MFCPKCEKEENKKIELQMKPYTGEISENDERRGRYRDIHTVLYFCTNCGRTFEIDEQTGKLRKI